MIYIITAEDKIRTNKDGTKEVDAYSVGCQADLKKYFGVQLTSGGFIATNCMADFHIYSFISGVQIFHVHHIRKDYSYTVTIN